MLARLPPVAAGFVLGVALGGTPADGLAEAAELLQGRHRDACWAALRALGSVSREERARALAQLVRAANEPSSSWPAGIERIHPGWLRAALQEEATPILLALVAGLPPEVVAVAGEIIEVRGEDPEDPMFRAAAELDADALAELRRALFVDLAPMPEPAAAARPDAPEWQRLAALPVTALLDELARRGAEVLGRSLHGAPPAVIARGAAGAGEAAGSVVLASAQVAVSPEQRDRARARVAAAAPLFKASDALGLAQAIGLVDAAEMLAGEDPDSAYALAQRLPPVVGQLLLRACALAMEVA